MTRLTAPTITAEEFAARPDPKLRKESGQQVYPCACGDTMCEGWAWHYPESVERYKNDSWLDYTFGATWEVPDGIN